jgi:Tol biopolymer transport system component
VQSIFCLFFRDRLVKHDLSTGEDKILYSHSNFHRGAMSLSPDGINLLLATGSPEQKKSRLFTIPAEGGKENILCTAQEPGNFYRASWSPDGKHIALAFPESTTEVKVIKNLVQELEKTYSLHK